MSSQIAALRDRVHAHVARMIAMISSVESDLAGRRFTATSDRGQVTAEADHTSRLIGITFADRTLTRTTGGSLGEQVVQAVNRAQRSAHQAMTDVARAQAHAHGIADRMDP